MDISRHKKDRETLLLFDKAAQTIRVGITITDPHHRILFINRADAAMHGYAPEELIGSDARKFGPGERRGDRPIKKIEGISLWTREGVNVHKDGSFFPVRLTSDVVRDGNDEIIGMVTTCEDISAWKKMEEELIATCNELGMELNEGPLDLVHLNEKLREEIVKRVQGEERILKLSSAVEQSPSIIMIADHNGTIEYVNPKFCEVTGYSPVNVIGFSLYDFCVSSSHGSREEIGDILLSGVEWRGEFSNRKKNGDIYWEAASMTGLKRQGKVAYLLKVAEDITMRKRIEDELMFKTLYDPLTDLPNRTLFFDRLGHSWERAKRDDSYFYGVLYLDLDRFKIVNDSLGHAVGDELLKKAGARLHACMRPGDTVGRLGGDEFGIIADNITDISDIICIAERIHKELEMPFHIGTHEIFITASIGIVAADNYESHADIVRDADSAMYMAKANGRGCHFIFNEAMHSSAIRLLEQESDLRRAVRRNEFRVFFQPIVCMSSGGIIGAEALVRWQHPNRGLIYPNEFIPLAEETGLICDIGKYVMREAASLSKALGDRGVNGVFISVNCSLRQLKQSDFVESIQGILDEYDISPGMIELEITESVAMDESMYGILRELNDRGIWISIDDFGTGYSSLSRLKSFPINTLKIDRSFIKDINTEADARDVISVIAAIAEKLRLFLIAEGVETFEQLQELKRLYCSAVQGYLFSRPIPTEEFMALMATKREGLIADRLCNNDDVQHR